MSFSVNGVKAANPAPLVPKPASVGVSIIDYTSRQEIYIAELLNSAVIKVINISGGTPPLTMPSPSQLLTLFQNPVEGMTRTLFLMVDAQVDIVATTPASQIVAGNTISLVTIQVRGVSTPDVNIQVYPVGAASVPHPIAFSLTVGAGATLSANLTKPQLGSTLTELTLQGVTVAAAPLTFSTAASYYTIFSGSPALPMSYSFYINNDGGNTVTLTNSASVTISYGPSVLANGSVYQVTLHFNSTGTTAKAGIVQIA